MDDSKSLASLPCMRCSYLFWCILPVADGHVQTDLLMSRASLQ